MGNCKDREVSYPGIAYFRKMDFLQSGRAGILNEVEDNNINMEISK